MSRIGTAPEMLIMALGREVNAWLSVRRSPSTHGQLTLRLEAVMSLRNLAFSCSCLAARSEQLLALYLRAAATSEPGLRLVLEENAQTLVALVADLGAKVPATTTWQREFALCARALHGRAVMASMHMAGNREALWIALLARREAGLLRAFERAATAAPTAAAHLLGRQLLHLHALQHDMRCLTAAAGS